MKRSAVIVILLSILLLLIVGSSYCAEEGDLDDEKDKLISEIDFTDIDEFLNSVEGGSILKKSFSTLIKEFSDGKIIDIETFFNVIQSAIEDAIKDTLSIYLFIIAIMFFSSLSSCFVSDNLLSGTKPVVETMSYAAVAAVAMTVAIDNVKDVTEVIANIGKFSEISFPILSALLVSLGGTVSAGLFQPIMIAFSGVVMKFINTVSIPLLSSIIVLQALGNLNKKMPLNKLTKTLKSFGEWSIGAIFSVFTIVVTGSGIIGSTTDTIAAKTLKASLSTYVPILGGYLSDGFDIILGSVLVVRNSLGVVALIVIATIVIIPTVRIAIISLLFKLCGGIGEILGEDGSAELLYGLGKNLNFLIGILLGSALICSSIFLTVIYGFGGAI